MLNRLAPAFLLMLAAPTFVQAQPLKGGGEFRINVATTGHQQYPRVAASPTGQFVVVWNAWPGDADGAAVWARRYGSDGRPSPEEFQVNVWTTGYQGVPSVAMGADSDFLVSWDLEGEGDDSGAFGRPFDGDTPLPSGEFLLNVYTPGGQFSPSVAGSPGGGFVVAWSSSDQDGSGTGIFARRVDPDGYPSGGEFQVNEITSGSQRSPAVAMDGSGNFVVVWQGPLESGPGEGLFGRRFDESGQPLGGEFLVESIASYGMLQPDVAMNSGGDFIVVWQGAVQGYAQTDIFARRFDSSGSPEGGRLQVSLDGAGYHQSPSVAMDYFGNFQVVWESYGPDLSGYGIFGKTFIYPDQPVGDEFQVNSYTEDSQARPDVTAAGLGDFVTVWHSYGQDGDGYGVFGQRHVIRAFCAAGDPEADGVCDDFDNCPLIYNPSQADANADGVGDLCSIAFTSPLDGSAVDCGDPALVRPELAWSPGSYDRFKVFISPDPGFGKGQRVSSGDTWLRTASWIPPRKKWKKACRKAGEASPSAPVLYMKVVGKDRDLSKKDPLRISESAAILVDVVN